MTTSFIHRYGPEIAHDYPVCAIEPGQKRPIGKEWQKHPLSPEECRDYPNEAAGVGIMCGQGDNPVYAVDVDVYADADCAHAIYHMIEEVTGQADLPYRVGNYPKLLVPLIGTEVGWKKMTTAWYEKDGLRSRVELLGDGQQFVAAAIHPDTKQPYEWHGERLGGSLIDIPEAMPIVSLAKLQDILRKAEKILEAHGWQKADGGSEVKGTEISADELAPQYPIGATIEEARTWLADMPGKDDYDVWLKVGMALNHEFGKGAYSEEALQVWDEWSRDSKSYKGFDDLLYRWAGFGRRLGRSVTCRWLQYEYQRRHFDKAAEPTEEGRAARFASYFRGSVRYAIDTEQWYQWTGLFWRLLSPSEAESLAGYAIDELLRFDIDAARKAGKEDAELAQWNKLYRAMQSGNKPRMILAEARKYKIIHCLSTDFDSNARYFGVRNGAINLETGAFCKPEPAMLISFRAGTSYDPEAKCPTWEQTVSEAFFDDPEMIDYVQRLFGYTILGKPYEEVMAIFYGNGCNGKSTIVNVMRDLFGDYGHTASAELLTSVGRRYSNAGGARADLIALKSKRFVVVSEIDQRARMQESDMKALVSTDEVSARGMYQSQMSTFRPTWVVTMLTNYLPTIDGTDNGVWRRIHAVPFDRDFDKDETVKKDVHRADKLRAELPGILNWVLEGVKKYNDCGLKQPPKVAAESAEYKSSQDIIGEWLSERCVSKPGAAAPTSVAWASWDAFSKQNGYQHDINSKAKLTRALARRGFRVQTQWMNGRNVRCYMGISVGDDFEELL